MGLSFVGPTKSGKMQKRGAKNREPPVSLRGLKKLKVDLNLPFSKKKRKKVIN